MGSVKDKIDDIKKQKEINKTAVKEIFVGVRTIKDKIKKQEQENVAAIKAIGAGAKAIADAIKATKDNFKTYTKEFYGYE